MKEIFILDNTAVLVIVLLLIFFVIATCFQSFLIQEKNREIKQVKQKNDMLRNRLSLTQQKLHHITYKLPEVE